MVKRKPINYVLIKTLGFLLISSFLLISCKRTTVRDIPSECTSGRFVCLKGNAIVEIQTNKGKITLELNGRYAPLTSGNFLDLIQKGVYNKTIFHRVIKTPMPFVVQGGDPSAGYISSSNNEFGKGNYINPDNGQARLIPLEIKLKNEKFPRYGKLINNPNKLSEIELRHEKGSFAMARTQYINSASAQFYIALRSLPELDGRYAVFGKIINGIKVLDKIEQGDFILNTRFVRFKK